MRPVRMRVVVAAAGPVEMSVVMVVRMRGGLGRVCLLDPYSDALAADPQGHLVASGGLDGLVVQWRPMRGPDLRGKDPVQVHDLEEAVGALAWSPDGAWLLAGGRAGRLIRWTRP